MPSPCGPNSQCRDIGGVPSCSCLASYVGSPPNCRPECSINQECLSSLACIQQKCRDPCPGSCGFGAQCSVINHTPICSCPEGFTGDPFANCHPKPTSNNLKLIKKFLIYKIRENSKLKFQFLFSHRTSSIFGSLQSISMWFKRSV